MEKIKTVQNATITQINKQDNDINNTKESIEKTYSNENINEVTEEINLETNNQEQYKELEEFYQTNPDLNLNNIILDGYAFNKDSEIKPLSLEKGGCGISNFIMIYYLLYGKKLDFVEIAKEAVEKKLYNGRGSEYYHGDPPKPNEMFEDYKISVKKIDDNNLNIDYITNELKNEKIITSVVQYGENNYEDNGFNPSSGGHFVSIIDYDESKDLYYVFNPYTYTYEDGTKKNTSGWYSKEHIQKYYIDVIDSEASVSPSVISKKLIPTNLS